MSKVVVLALPGSGFPNGGDGITEDFLSRLDSSRYETEIVSYPATGFGLGGAYASSVEAGIAMLRAAAETTDRFILAGYSQGAVAAGDLAATLGHELASRCAGVALIADGRRPAGALTSTPGHPIAPGYGIVGERYIPTAMFPALWASASGDPICALPAGNPLRTLADIAPYFSVRSPVDVIRWGRELLDLALERGYQHWWNLNYWRDWDEAGNYARGFLFDGRHTDDYVRYGHTRALAEAINGQDWR